MLPKPLAAGDGAFGCATTGAGDVATKGVAGGVTAKGETPADAACPPWMGVCGPGGAGGVALGAGLPAALMAPVAAYPGVPKFISGPGDFQTSPAANLPPPFPRRSRADPAVSGRLRGLRPPRLSVWDRLPRFCTERRSGTAIPDPPPSHPPVAVCDRWRVDARRATSPPIGCGAGVLPDVRSYWIIACGFWGAPVLKSARRWLRTNSINISVTQVFIAAVPQTPMPRMCFSRHACGPLRPLPK